MHTVQDVSAVMDLGKDVFEPGMAYIALSRMHTLNRVALLNFEPQRMTANKRVYGEMARLQQQSTCGSVWQETANGRSLCFIAGDFNSKVGLQSSTVLEECMGKYGKSSRNENGQALMDWAIQKGAFLCNAAFQHPCRHRTTRTGWIKTTQGETKQPIYNQIDFILSQMKLKPLLSYSRSYGGAETNSDHKIVVAIIDLKGMFTIWSKNLSLSVGLMYPSCLGMMISKRN